MGTKQATFRLRLPDAVRSRLTQRELIHQESILNRGCPAKVPDQKLLADLLKRQIQRIVSDITECPPDTIPAHLARLNDWRDTAGHVMRHNFAETAECRRSDRQLIYAETIADWCAVAEITRQQHRAPAFVNSRDAEIAAIHHKLDLMAGLLSQLLNVPTPEPFTNNEGENERH